jgi:hypothetical protein
MYYAIISKIVFFFFCGTRVLIQGFMLTKQVLYLSSHTFSPVWYGYFGDGGLTNYLPRLALNFDPPNLSLLSS